jgi:hypothetical protein
MKTPYVDDSEFTEITIQPDGRVYVFGLTPQVADALKILNHPPGGSAPADSPVKTQVNVYTPTGEPHGEG